jgi:D-alanine-D-alanine ligase-like ATP-grasp enzyme
MNPSITVASSSVLSLEEKFQGGTGINITPPPPEILSPALTTEVRRKIALVAEKLGIRGFARIDAFVHTATGDVVIIEANTVPGLTPSTVLYHQGLAECPPLYPRALLEKFLEYA